MSGHNALYELYQAPYLMDDPGDTKTIVVARQLAVVPLVSGASAETRTLAQPTKPGIICKLELDTDGGGDITVTVTGGYNQGGSTTIVLGDAADYVILHSVKVGTSYYWRVWDQEGTDVLRTDLTVSTLVATNATASKISITQTTVNAAGSAIGNAAALSYGVNVVGGADNTKGVILPVATANAVVEVLQVTNGQQLAVYPQVNSAIAGLTANVAFNTGVANTAAQAGTTQNVYFKFVATNTTQWYASK